LSAQLAQQKPSPEVDQALRARITQFHQAYVDGKFRVAEQLVAEDSRDFFFEIEKQRYEAFGPPEITYSDNGTKARVMVVVTMEVRNARMGKITVRPPVTSFWKLENGQWYWYHLQEKVFDTPFGKAVIRDEKEPDDAQKKLASFKRVSPSELLNQVRVSATVVNLSSFEPASGEVKVSNNLPGQVTLDIQFPPMEGLTITPDKKVLKSGETATVSFQSKPVNSTPKGTIIVNIVVQPLNQTFPITVTFPVPRPARSDNSIH